MARKVGKVRRVGMEEFLGGEWLPMLNADWREVK